MGQAGLIKKLTNRESVVALLTVATLLLPMLLPLVGSKIASAEAIRAHSIQVSTASISAPAESVSYTIQFTPEETAAAFVVDFCTNTPVFGQSCTAPTGLDLSEATTPAGATLSPLDPGAKDNAIVVTKAMTADAPQTVVLNAVTNPTVAGVVYARIVTYAVAEDAEAYESEDPGATEDILDIGSVAMFFNNSITVSGTVLETLTFCVGSAAIEPACANAEVNLSSLVLGDEQGEASGIFALTAGKIHTKPLFTQINTNASSGAIVRLRSSAPCGGLMRTGTTTCDIAPAGAVDLATTSANFGVKLGTAAAAVGASGAVGTLQAADGSIYSAAAYAFNFDDDDVTGVTSPLGDPFLDTAGAPASDMNLELTFGATVTNSTPAGTYTTDLSMIAVGKF